MESTPMSRFQGSAFRCDKIVVNSKYTFLLEAIEGIPSKDYNYFLGNDKFSNLYKRQLHEQKRKSEWIFKADLHGPCKSALNIHSLYDFVAYDKLTTGLRHDLGPFSEL